MTSAADAAGGRAAIGVHGFPLPTVGEVDQGDLDAVAAAGLEVLSLYMTPEERAQPGLWADTLRGRIESAGLRLFSLAASASKLLAHDEFERRREVEEVAAGVAAVVAAGAERLFVQPGGFNPEGPWWFHRENFAPASRRAFARSLRELGQLAEAGGVGIVLEGFQSSVVESTVVMRALIEEAGSPAVGANLDYVNFLTPPAVARWPEALLRMADDLGPTMVSIHVKDCIVEPRLSCHVDERPAGSGDLDLQPVIELGRRTGVPLLVEHLNESTAEEAIRTLVQLAR